MKYIKRYEKTEEEFDEDEYVKPIYNVGDDVICVYVDQQDLLEKGKKYIITRIYVDKNRYFCYVKDIYDTPFFCYRFCPEYQVDANKYNL